MRSYLLKEIPDHLAALAVEGYHKPGSLTQASGAWISCAGSFVLEKGTWPLNPHDQWIWLAVEKGSIVLFWDNHELALAAGSTCFLPGGRQTLRDLYGRGHPLPVDRAGRSPQPHGRAEDGRAAPHAPQTGRAAQPDSHSQKNSENRKGKHCICSGS